MNKGTLGVHEVKLVIQPGPGLHDGRGVGEAAGVGDIRVGGEGRVGPVKILLGAAAVQLQ